MSRSVYKKFTFLIPNHIHIVYGTKESIANPLRLLQTLALNPNPNTTNPQNQHNPTVSYLITKCGLPLDSALSASKHLTITSTPKADSVLNLFKSHGFTHPQITDLISKWPSIVVSDPDQTLKPKLEFLESLGFSNPDIVSNCHYLQRSLRNQIIPTVDFLSTILHTNENIVTVLKEWSYLSYHNRDFRHQLVPNVATLRDHGMPESSITRLLIMRPIALVMVNGMFRDRLKRVEGMGLDPNSLGYLRVVRVLVSVTDACWEKKIDILKSFGWSENDVLVAFKMQPQIMLVSEKKIRVLMDFYYNRLGFKACDVAKCPNLLTFSLEKRLIPRCSVLNLLLSKDLVSGLNIVSALNMMKGKFEKMFVTRYLEVVPEMMSVYQSETKHPSFEALKLKP